MKIFKFIGCIAILLLGYGCQKDNQKAFKKFLGDSEVVYPGAISSVTVQPGNLAIGLKWKTSTDPSIIKYIVFYNNGLDSQIVDMPEKTDTIRTVIRGLVEYTYSFTIYSYDANGNRSIPYNVNNAKVYGPIYISTLLNRAYDAGDPFDITPEGYVRLNFMTPDTINIGTTIKYTNINGLTAEKVLPADDTSILLTDYKPGTPIIYNSSYIPEREAIDVFYAPKSDTFPPINGIAECDKSLFKKIKLPFDMDPYQRDTDIDKLWSGATTTQSFPNLFHADENGTLPRTLTFDMGRIYTKLVAIEEIGRDCCNNPDDFEVWGIADITNAATDLPSDDPAWKDEAMAKGWTLLKEVKRNDDGSAPFRTDLDSKLPPVRFIRIRVLHNANGEEHYTNISQITLFADLFN